jgi:hypothetical protein
MESITTMKRAFILTSRRHLISAIVPEHTPGVLNIGDRITTSRLLDLGTYAQIAEGETGTVDHIDAVTGLIEILLDTFHRGLAAWDNHMWLEPFGTDDIIGGIILAVCSFSELQSVVA